MKITNSAPTNSQSFKAHLEWDSKAISKFTNKFGPGAEYSRQGFSTMFETVTKKLPGKISVGNHFDGGMLSVKYVSGTVSDAFSKKPKGLFCIDGVKQEFNGQSNLPYQYSIRSIIKALMGDAEKIGAKSYDSFQALIKEFNSKGY